MILSQFLRGLAEVLGPLPLARGRELAEAFGRAAGAARAAVADPVEGTVLTVARAAAEAARAAGSDELAAVVRAAGAGAAEALRRTPEQLPVLARAGVVDAGGYGLCVLLDALVVVVTGDAAAGAPPPDLVVPRERSTLDVAREAGSDSYAYEVQYLLAARDAAVRALREALCRLGDSVVVVGGDGLHAVHAHVNDVGAAIEAGLDAGRPSRITVTRFADQVADQVAARRRAAGGDVPAPAARRAVVAVASGRDLAALFEREGATVVPGGPTANPSTREVLAAVEATGADEVVLLPNDRNVLRVAEQAAAATRTGATRTGADRGVAVVPTRSPVQGLAALAVGDPDRPFADDVAAMTVAAGATRYAALTRAVRAAGTPAGPVRAGDVLGLLGDEVVAVGPEAHPVATGLLDRMLAGGGELVTLVVGAGCPPDLPDRLVAHLAAVAPSVEVVTYDGGQPHYLLLMGVE